MPTLTEAQIRRTVWLTVPFNLVAAFAFGFPTGFLGRLVGLPAAPPLYAAFVAFLVALLGAMYLWIASQPSIHRPLLAFGAIGKVGVFAIVVLLFLSGNASWEMLLASSGDLAFGALWLVWLRSTRA